MIALELQRLILSALLFLAGAFLLRWLWNMTMPALLGYRQADYWQALRLMLVAGILATAAVFMIQFVSASVPFL